jgi:hypothetical protein
MSLCNAMPNQKNSKGKTRSDDTTGDYTTAGHVHLHSSEGLRVWNDPSTGLMSRRHRSTGKLSSLLVLCEGGGSVEVLVDDARHAVLAMVPDRLRAVEPERVLVLDRELEHLVRLALVDLEVEAGEESLVVDGHAGLVEGGLRHRVVLGQVVPLDNVAHLGNDVVGLEFESAATGDHGVGYACQRDSLGWDRGAGVGGQSRRGAGVG